ncbi:MAG TPA: hypothetical protein VH500_21315 [Nitrososphaeraceae archaeon]
MSNHDNGLKVGNGPRFLGPSIWENGTRLINSFDRKEMIDANLHRDL